ncbi:mucin-5AC-like isoform X1 [Centruroides sculpturatus]|uniref:mucin-5AC-like isoform X1 n=2 Tax=Centruroides sculpturatus TaxID=218467 RepID=UPI000C6E8A6C|nr:mucin-5AC-like isoform X1 [Centruroides sculpturatus]XP_023242007.1 mucin-5AC-like isoform X1 [Centruroides sculpturatus]
MWSRSPTVIVLLTTSLMNSVVSSRHLLQIPDVSSNFNVFVRAIPSNSQQNRPEPLQQYRPPIFAELPQSSKPQIQMESSPQVTQYQPPLFPLPQSHPQPHPPQTPNQQVIYVGGQQGVYSQVGAPSPSQQGVPASKGVERKVVKPAQQLIQKAPASEIQFDKATGAKEKDSKPDDEYVVYYYYYYDNDTNSNNLTLDFDNIPDLESYDQKNDSKTNASQYETARQLSPVTVSSSISTAQSVEVVGQPLLHRPVAEKATTSSPKGATAISVSVSVSEGTEVQPVRNVFRYGSNDVPRVPVTPNLVDPLEEPEVTPDGINTTQNATTTSSSAELQSPPATEDVLTTSIPASQEEKQGSKNEIEEETQSEEVTTQDYTTTTETTTTTELTTTTTERGRLGNIGKRKRFRTTAASSSRRTTPSTTTQSTNEATADRRPGFRPPTRNRFSRPGAPIARTRPGSTNNRKFGDNSLSDTTTSSSVATATKNRFGATTRRSSSRVNPTKPSRTTQPRARATVKPPVNILSNRQRSRPSFFRPRNKKGETETTTIAETETPAPTTATKITEVSATTATTKEAEEEITIKETPEETEQPPPPTTTATPENRFSGLFRSRPRPNLLGNRPRPNILSRPRT